MTRIHNILTGILLLSFMFWGIGCSEKEDISPSNADTNRLESLLDRTIPDIADFCDKYGTYILYDFDQRLDFAYQFEQATAWEKASIEKLNHDGAVVSVAWLKTNVFSHYTDEFKSKYLPRKFLITQSVKGNETLGRVSPYNGTYSVLANINSITVAQYENAQDVDRAILADYLVNARGENPVEKAFFEPSQIYYSTLMDSHRLQAKQLLERNPDFFHDNGFLNPSDEETTYFPSSRLDLVQYIDSLVGMTEQLHDMIMNSGNTDMLTKMAYVAHGLQSIGVNVGSLNPWAIDFLEVNISGVNPTVKFNNIPAAFSSQETIEFTVLRGENNLQKAEIYMNNALVESFDFSSNSDAPSVTVKAKLTNLQPQANDFYVWVYEEGKTRPSAKVKGTINYYTSNNVVCLTINDDNPDSYTRENYRLTIDYKDGIVDNRKESNIITITFNHKAKFDPKTWMDYDGEKRYWRAHFNGDVVDWIEEYEEVVDYTTFSSSNVLRHTYVFNYDEDGQLTKVVKVQGSDSKVIVDDVTCLNGHIISYVLHENDNNRLYFPQYSALDGKTRVDLLDKDLSGARFIHVGTEDTNPFYIAGIPAVLPGNVAGVPLHFIYGEYLFNSVDNADGNPLWNNGWTIDRSDAKNPFNGTTALRDGHTWYYRIILSK